MSYLHICTQKTFPFKTFISPLYFFEFNSDITSSQKPFMTPLTDSSSWEYFYLTLIIQYLYLFIPLVSWYLYMFIPIFS